MKEYGSNCCLMGSLLTTLFFSMVTCHLRFSISSGGSFGNLHFSEKLSILSKFICPRLNKVALSIFKFPLVLWYFSPLIFAYVVYLCFLLVFVLIRFASNLPIYCFKRQVLDLLVFLFFFNLNVCYN